MHQSNPLSRFVSATSVEPVGTPPVSISTAPVPAPTAPAPAPTAPAPVPTAPVPVPVAPFGGGGKGRRMMERKSGKKGVKKATKKDKEEESKDAHKVKKGGIFRWRGQGRWNDGG